MGLITYGVKCQWADKIENTGRTKLREPGGVTIPCCPRCSSVLFQIEEETWWAGVDRYEREGHPGYRKFIEWKMGKCFATMREAEIVFENVHGRRWDTPAN